MRYIIKKTGDWSKMSALYQRLRLTDDHTLESSTSVTSRLHLDDRLPPDWIEESLRGLGFESEEENGKNVDSHFVLQGQALVLGDSRVGKTSLVKSLTGKPFDSEEPPKTQGTECSLVDRRWNSLGFNEGLKFGYFSRFAKSVLILVARYGPGNKNETLYITVTLLRLRGISILSLITLFSMFFKLTLSGYGFQYPNLTLGIHVLLFVTLLFIARYLFLTSILRFTKLHLMVIGFAISCSVVRFVHGNCRSHHGHKTSLDQTIVFLFTTTPYIPFVVCEGLLWLIWFTPLSRWLFIVSNSNIPGQAKSNYVRLFIICYVFGSSIVSFITGIILGCGFGSFTNSCHYSCDHLLSILAQVAVVISTVQESLTCIGCFSKISLTRTSSCCIAVYVLFYCNYSYFVTVVVILVNGMICANWSTISTFFNKDPGRVRNTTFLEIQKVILDGQKLKLAIKNTFSTLKLKIIDFAGDKEYYAYYHMFLRSHAVYVIVFDMESFVKDNFKNLTEQIKRISFWLESVFASVQSKIPIFLVGTHRGSLDDLCIETINGYLRQELWDLFCDELVMNHAKKLIYFPVENSKGQTDTGIKNLRESIMSVAEDHKTTIGRDVPYSWIKIQDKIIERVEGKDTTKFCVTMDEFWVDFNKDIFNKWSKQTLKYFHEKGLVVYLDKDPQLSNWVLLKPELLVDIMIMLVTPPLEEVEQRGFRRDWKLLHDTGKLTESLLRNILSKVPENKEAMTAFLIEYHLICPLFHESINNDSETEDEAQKVTHFVPFLLPLSSDVDTPLWHHDSNDKTFYVFFKRFLPEPLFYCLLSRAHKSSMLLFNQGRPIMYRDAGVFWLERCPYRLALLKDEDMIEVTFSPSSKARIKPSDVLVQVYTMVEDICNRDFPFVKFHCGPACHFPRCPGHQERHLSNSFGRQRATRRHVFNVMPARKKDRACSFYCLNHNLENEYREWEP